MRTKVLFVAFAALLATSLLASPLSAGSRTYVSIRVDPFWWGWGPSWGYYYRPYYPPMYPAPVLTSRSVGAVDLKVKPKKAEVWVDGQLAGKAGRFDGFPGYLWLDDGEHQLVLVHDGFETVARTIEVRGGTLVDLKVQMAKGASVPASEFFVAASKEDTAPRSGSSVTAYSEAERSRVKPREPAAASESDRAEASLDARAETARLELQISPADASVYLDGRFLGTVSELDRLHAGILVDPGNHTLSAVRPGYLESELDFEAVSGEELVLSIELERE